MTKAPTANTDQKHPSLAALLHQRRRDDTACSPLRNCPPSKSTRPSPKTRQRASINGVFTSARFSGTNRKSKTAREATEKRDCHRVVSVSTFWRRRRLPRLRRLPCPSLTVSPPPPSPPTARPVHNCHPYAPQHSPEAHKTHHSRTSATDACTYHNSQPKSPRSARPRQPEPRLPSVPPLTHDAAAADARTPVGARATRRRPACNNWLHAGRKREPAAVLCVFTTARFSGTNSRAKKGTGSDRTVGLPQRCVSVYVLASPPSLTPAAAPVPMERSAAAPPERSNGSSRLQMPYLRSLALPRSTQNATHPSVPAGGVLVCPQSTKKPDQPAATLIGPSPISRSPSMGWALTVLSGKFLGCCVARRPVDSP